MLSLLSNLRQLFTRPVQLRLGQLRWFSRYRVCCGLCRLSDREECTWIEVEFLVGVDLEAVPVLLDDGRDPNARAWFEAHEEDLVLLYDERLASEAIAAYVGREGVAA